MTQTQAKAIQEAFDLIHSFETYDVYKKMKDNAIEQGVEEPVFSKIWGAGESRLTKEKEKLSQAKDWLRVILNDSKEQK